MNNPCYTNPRETLRSLKIYRSIISKQISYFPLSMELLRSNSKKLIAVIDLYINDYENFFKELSRKQNDMQQQLKFEDNKYN